MLERVALRFSSSLGPNECRWVREPMGFAGESYGPFIYRQPGRRKRDALLFVLFISLNSDGHETGLGSQLVAHAPDSKEECRTGWVLLDLLSQRMNVHI